MSPPGSPPGLLAGRYALALSGEPFPVRSADTLNFDYKFRRLDVDYDTAEPAARALLPLFEKVLGPEHPDTPATRQMIASGLKAQGKAAEAKAAARLLLPLLEKVKGLEHPDTLTTVL